MRTWHVEMIAAGAVLAAVVLATGDAAIEWIGAGAVLLSFAHAQVADRLAEGERDRIAIDHDAAADRRFVHCHRWAARYLVGKESLWLIYFVMHHSWSALAGVALLLLYPVWRAFWRHKHSS